MTRYALDHAVVMDTDDIPGRGGYAVVGISRGVAQAERLFVAQHFGISDFLHDPQNDRTFYSFFRVPGGRRAFVRRFANGRRRNGTQNRLFVHTIFFDDALFDGLHGLPWLLLEANVRAEGTGEWQPLRNEVPWLAGEVLPPLEVDLHVDINDIPRRLSARLALAAKEVPNAEDVMAGVIAALRDEKRVALPQGRGYEWLTLLAWSMLPRRDREELAWTQHDTLNISAVTFHIANAVSASADVRPAPIAKTIIERNLTGWRAFHELAARFALTIRRAETLEACLAHRDAICDLDLPRLAETAKKLRGQPCFDREALLDLVWERVPPARLQESGLAVVLLSEPPSREWLDRAGDPNRLVDFFLDVDSVNIGPIAEWAKVDDQRMARLIARAYRDEVANRRELLKRLQALELLPLDDEELLFDAFVLAAQRDDARFLDRRELARPLIALARALDETGDSRARKAFIEATQQLEIDLESLDGATAGPCTRALLLAARRWTPRLTALFWSNVPAEDVARVPEEAIDALAQLTAAQRKPLAETWIPRLRQLPKNANSERLLQLLYENTDGAELRARLALRDVDQGLADETTLNRLDAALYALHGASYTREMAAALAKYSGDSRAARIRKLCALLASPRALPTVKRVIETHVLPQALKTLREDDWMALAAEDALFCRGPATLTIAFELGAHASADAARQFEEACHAQRRLDAAESLAAGRRQGRRAR